MVASFTHDPGRSDEGPASRLETLAGSWLFFLGLIAMILSYVTVPHGDLHAAWVKWLSAIRIAMIILGLGAGWFKGWPRWSLPYLGMLITFAFATLNNKIFSVTNLAAIRGHWLETAFTIIPLLFFITFIFFFVLITRILPPLHKLYRNFRLDWTRLSFSLYVTALFFSTVDHDEDPVFTFNVFLPSVLILTGALVHLRSGTKMRRYLALLGAIILAVFIRAAGGQFFYYGFFGSWVVALITAPALLTILPPYRDPPPSGS